LLKRAIEEIEQSGSVVKIELSVNNEMTSAYNLYVKNGFKKAGLLKKELKNGNTFYDEIVKEKFI
jgi:ribosomal protein S18 acetylase RimI-like enzyme